VLSLTPNEATIAGGLAGAALGAVASIFTTRYLVKHGPNYGEQITNIHGTLAALAETQENLRQQMARTAADEKERHVAVEKRAEAARWKPEVRIETKVDGDKQANTLILKSAQSFALTEAALISPSGAKLFDYSVMGSKLFSTGFSIPLPQESLNKVAAISPSFFQQETFSGSLRYTVKREKEPVPYTGEIPFQGQRIYVGQNACFKLNG